MRHIFCRKTKVATLFIVSALLIVSSFLNIVGFIDPAFAVSSNDAKTVCDEMGGEFTDNSTTATSNIGECKGEISAEQREILKQSCLDAGGTFSDMNGFSCTWSEFDDVQKTPKASAIKEVCESVEGTTYANMGTFATCHDLPTLTCQAHGGTNISSDSQPICKWENIIDDSGTTPTPTTDTDGIEATCHNAAAALSWILCPVLEGAASATTWAYETVIIPFLDINPRLFRTDGDQNGTYQAWSKFRDIANIIFAIFLLLIILSQVSGVGIDNYGIKKSLPKLIIAAVLVNISFYFCQALIDISNILGSSLYNLFNGIAEDINVVSASGDRIVGSIALNILVVIGGGATGMALLLGRGALWTLIKSAFLAVLPVLLSAVIALLMLFLLLSVRQAIVVLLVALSPLAFVCYIFPNTKKLFDNWSKILRGMLLLYPIAAILMAGGRLASRIVFASGAAVSGNVFENIGTVISAMAAEVVPLFFIPTLTRSAYNATGQLGAALNRISTRAVAGTRHFVRGRQSYQRAVGRVQNERAQQRLTSGRSGRRIRRYQESSDNVAMGTGTRMDRWRLRASNRDRVSALMRDAASRAAAVGESRAWAQANPNEVTRGSEEKAMINATQQIVNTADYANADFSNAVIRQNQTEHENARERQLMWNQNNYRAGKENANAAARDAELKNTQLWVDEKYIQGKLNQNELNTRNDRKTTELYAREDYATSRANQQDVAISNETTKMYADKFSRLSMKDVMRELANSVDTTSGEDHTERFIAASEALIRSGQADKVRSIISGDNSEFASAGANFSSLVKGKENFRNRVAQVLGSSGEFTFQEYAKHLGQEGGTAKSFQEWADGTDEKSLAASIKAKGLDRMDKDGFEYLSKHTAALNAADVENISKVAASTTDAATVAKFVQAIEKLDQSKREKIIEHTSADRAANMDQSIRDALAGAKLERRNKEGVVIQSAATANDSLWQKQIGEAIRNNPQIAARFSKENRKRYAPSEETFSDGGGI